MVSAIVSANGAVFHFEYRDPQDGSDSPVSGNPYYDSESTVWRDERTAIRTERRAGKVIGETTFAVAKDGRSYTASSSRTTPEDGHLYVSFIRWERVPDREILIDPSTVKDICLYHSILSRCAARLA